MKYFHKSSILLFLIFGLFHFSFANSNLTFSTNSIIINSSDQSYFNLEKSGIGSICSSSFSSPFNIVPIFCGSLPNGNYILYINSTGNNIDTLYQDKYFFSVNGGIIGYNSNNLNTHIISLTPIEGTTTQNPVTFGMEYYISPNDIGLVKGIKITLHNIDQNVLFLSDLSPSDIYFYDRTSATSSGYFNFSTTTTIGEGNYRIEAQLEGTTILGIINPLRGVLGVIDYKSHQFIVGASTFLGNISQSSYNALNNYYASSTATTTTGMIASCNVFTDGSFIKCLTYLFVPDQKFVKDSIENVKNNILTHFPLGYISDAYSILATTSTTTLTVVDATLPMFGNPHIYLNISHSLDYILNATSSIFNNISASSTQTFYQITSYYWKIIVYILAGFYILARIIGGFIMPEFGEWQFKNEGIKLSKEQQVWFRDNRKGGHVTKAGRKTLIRAYKRKINERL